METNVKDGVTGWRGRIGWVSPAVPSSISLVDFHSVVPEGIELKLVTLGITAHSAAEVDQALAKLDDAARRLAIAGAQFISVEGTPLVSLKGFGFDKEIIRRVQEVAKVPATTSLTAAVDALHALKLKKLAMASPMTHEFDQRAKKFLEDSGFEIIHVKSLNMTYNRDIHALPRSMAYTVAKQAFMEAPQAEGIYLPCGAWCPPWCIDKIETDLGVPAIHSRQATTWAALKSLHIKEPVKGWGKLFETLYKN
jgi:maleate isomerase